MRNNDDGHASNYNIKDSFVKEYDRNHYITQVGFAAY